MRLVQGRSGWWCIAPAGTALLPAGWVHNGRLVAGNLGGLTVPPPVRSYALTVLVSTACNLGCGYCFQNTGPAAPGRTDPPRIPSAALDPGTAAAIVDFTRERMVRAGLTRLHLLLFGGEPLANPAGCRELLRRCAALGPLDAAMVSNGTLLDPALAGELAALGLRSVQVTMDGPQWIHDGTRVTRNGRATYHRILANVAAAQRATPLRFTLRVNLTPAVLPHLTGLVTELAGRVDARRCRLQIAPVREDATPGLPPGAAAGVVAAYRLARRLGFRIPRPADASCAFCGERDGRVGAVVNADGTLYSCWESAGRPGFGVGTVRSGYRSYPAGQWVSCRPYPDPRFADDVDAGLLDLLWEERRDRPCPTR